MLKFSTTNFRSESWKLFCLVGAFIQRHSLCIFCVARIKGQADFVQRRHVCNFEHAISTSDHISNACLLMDLLTVIEEPEAGKDYRGRSRSLFTDFSPILSTMHLDIVTFWCYQWDSLSFLMNFFDCPLASSFNWESWSWLELLQRCRVGQVQSWSCAELRSRMWSCAQSSKLHHIPQMRLCICIICRFVSFGCSKNIEKWWKMISITNHKQNFPTLNCLSPVVGFLRALLHLLWATMPCPAPGCITWKLGIAAARGRRLFLGCGGCLEIYGNLIYMSQSKQDLMICVLYGVQSPIKNFCHPSWRWILSPFSLWNVSFCHIPWLLE